MLKCTHHCVNGREQNDNPAENYFRCERGRMLIEGQRDEIRRGKRNKKLNAVCVSTGLRPE